MGQVGELACPSLLWKAEKDDELLIDSLTPHPPVNIQLAVLHWEGTVTPGPKASGFRVQAWCHALAA